MIFNRNFKLLIVDDNPQNIKLISETLGRGREPYDISFALSGQEAFDLVESHEFDLILLDIKMPGINGFEVCEKLKKNEETRDIPVIFISQLDDSESIVEGFKRGGRDYVTKDSAPVELRARVRNHLELKLKNDRLTEEKKKSDELLGRTYKQKEEINRLLLNIFPAEVAEELKYYGTVKPYHYKRVSVLFADFKDFSVITKKLTPEALISKLSMFFSAFDRIIADWEIEKIKTIGDAYMCVGGLPRTNHGNPAQTILSGFEMQRTVKEVMSRDRLENKDPWELRIGIHTGDVIAGVVGERKYNYDIWGDTVNVASRMEAEGEPGKVNISEITYKEVTEYFECTHRGKIDA
ncbi:MAG: adenylate/guanylate cyclase domain-containing response regulator, partial [bacterium]|nr:adenylate/guanylate cyclase domain-containing response regulator [bacterium]